MGLLLSAAVVTVENDASAIDRAAAEATNDFDDKTLITSPSSGVGRAENTSVLLFYPFWGALQMFDVDCTVFVVFEVKNSDRSRRSYKCIRQTRPHLRHELSFKRHKRRKIAIFSERSDSTSGFIENSAAVVGARSMPEK